MNFWNTVQIPNPVPEAYRESPPINSIPLFETQVIPDMVKHAKEILMSRHEELWPSAMLHNAGDGFDPDSQFMEKHFKVTIQGEHESQTLETNTWNLRSNHHYNTYQDMTGNTINKFKRIVELGGGVGDFCRFVHNMGFGGEYIIWDLPMVSRVQQLALKDLPVLYTHHIPKMPQHAEETLFVATWSLSETPLEFREKMLKKFKPVNYLICYQHEFEEFDNFKYFESWAGRQQFMYDHKSSYLCK